MTAHRVIVCMLVPLTLLLARVGYAQSPVVLSNWSVISSFQTARDAAVDGNNLIWVATSGGVYVTDTTGTVRDEYRTMNALQSMDVTAIEIDHRTGIVIVGSENGALDLRMPSGEWVNITDIRRAIQYPRRGIRDLVTDDSILYLATDFGVLTFDLTKNVFLETIDRLGPLQEKTRVNALAVVRDSLWVATDSGVVVAPLAVPTLRTPAVWRLLPLPDSAVPRVPHLASYEGSVVIASDTTVYRWASNVWIPEFSCPTAVNGLSYLGDTVRASCLQGVRTATRWIPAGWGGNVLGHRAARIHGTVTILAFPYERSLTLDNGDTTVRVRVNTPLSNQFARMAIDVEGGLWVATDVDPPRSGQGVARLHQGQWATYTAASTPAFIQNSAYRIQSFPNGTTVIGTWGGGAVVATLQGGEPQFERLTSSNSAFQGTTSSPTYVLAAESAMDRQGTIWVVNEQAAQQLLVSLDGGSTTATTGYANCVNRSDNLYRSLAIDNAGTKWVGGFNAQGLLAYNDRGTAETTDDVCQTLRSSTTQLPDNTITVLRTDRTGSLWIGTPKGVAVIASPTSVSNTTLPFVRRITALAALVINDIYVDALNYKWIATTNGAFVLNEDGTEVLASITSSNAPLANENVRSIVVNSTNGTAYFGTSTGCSVASSSSVAPASIFDLQVYPQPFSYQRDSEILIDGLAEDADIRIMTLSGTLIHAQKARGKQALWDGRDSAGQRVAPGVYILHATSAIDQTSAVQKIAITR